MSALERHCRWLLRAYPAWYRRERSEEMLGTLLEASPPGGKWPTFRDARALVTGGLWARDWAWLLAMLWVAAGAVFNGYIFYLTTMPLLPEDIGIAGWAEISVPLQIVIAVTVVVFCAALIAAPIAGFIRLRGWRRGNWRRAAAWAGAWTAGLALFGLSGYWGVPNSLLPQFARQFCAATVPSRQPCRCELGRAATLCRVAGTRGPDDLGSGSPFGCAQHQQPSQRLGYPP